MPFCGLKTVSFFNMFSPPILQQEIEDENDEATPSSSHQVNHSQKHPVLRFGFAASCLRGRYCCSVFVCCVVFCFVQVEGTSDILVDSGTHRLFFFGEEFGFKYRRCCVMEDFFCHIFHESKINVCCQLSG